MTKEQAFREMILGKKVHHPATFDPWEYLFIVGDSLINSEGYDYTFGDFFNVYQSEGFKIGWEIYNN